MDDLLKEKIEIIKKINIDDAQFILEVLQAYQKKKNDIKEKKVNTKIKNKNQLNEIDNVINLDKIWVKPYFYTKMKIRLEKIVDIVLNTEKVDIEKNPKIFCKKAIFNNAKEEFKKPEEETDIVDYIQILKNKMDNNTNITNFTFVADKIDEETLFKEEQLSKAIEIIQIGNKMEQYSKIYDEIINYLKEDFLSNNYCNFKNNKCVAQRHWQIYPINRKDGCCFMRIKKCKNLNKGKCNVECIACRLFSCPYLTKRGVGYWGNEIILLKAFFNKNQKKHLIFDFYKPKEFVLRKVMEEMV